MPFSRKIGLFELLPQTNKLYRLYLGDIPLKYKCNLVINIRSESTSEFVGGMVSFSKSNQSSRNLANLKKMKRIFLIVTLHAPNYIPGIFPLHVLWSRL